MSTQRDASITLGADPMGRIITITDDDLSLVARVEISNRPNGPVVTHISVSSEDDRGLPHRLMDALVPFIGLPTARTLGTNGQPGPARIMLPTQPDVTIAEPAPGEPGGSLPEREVPKPGPPKVTHLPPVLPVRSPSPQLSLDKRGRVVRPSTKIIENAIKQYGGSPSRLGKVFGVPPYTISAWKTAIKAEKEGLKPKLDDEVQPGPVGERAHGTVGREVKVS